MCAAVAAMAGCTVHTDTIGPDTTPYLSDADAAACERLIADLPGSIAGQPRREQDDSPYAAAWGDPAIVLACGAPMPDDYAPGATCIQADGVDWYVPDAQLEDKDETTPITMTAVGFRPVVTVEVPGDYRPEGLAAAMTEIGAVVSSTLTAGEPCAG